MQISPCKPPHLQYKNFCSKINLVLAEERENCNKAFGCTTKGKVLGIYLDTINLTQSLPEEKKNKTIIAINDIRSQKMASSL
jgi:hypothetical protein